ncbi:MAG TPA: glycosyltransferase [Solirubrobacteraceae bacterium]|nr:glycosyltransferase [Solirubrobacteraceae bacterium]
MGVSVEAIDGVRDYALVLADALRAEGVSCSLHWLSTYGLTGARHTHMRAWTRALPDQVRDAGADALLFHYSAFSYYRRGLPLLVHPMVTALRRCGVPLLTTGHELAYPWRREGAKGMVWASADRVALRELVAASDAVVVTTEFRLRWLRSRWWLPTRPISSAPVFSNLPPPAVRPPAARIVPELGLFGYALDAGTISLVLDAMRSLLERGLEPRLLLLGRPGRWGAADEWSRQARARGLSHALSFPGVLAAQELSDVLARCDALLYAQPIGPTSCKGTLAGSLASGRPLVALEGRRRWQQLLDADAARVVPRDALALADALTELLDDPRTSETLGARGRAFAEQEMGVARTLEVVVGLLQSTLHSRARDQRARATSHEAHAAR